MMIFAKMAKILYKITQPRKGIVSKKIGEDIISYDINTEIGQMIHSGVCFEKKEIELCSNYIKEDSVILDVGANIGLHSISYAKFAVNGLIIAIEPAKETFAILLKNVNDICNIIPLNVAVADKNSIEQFLNAEDNAYSSLKDTKRKKIKKIDNVLCYKLDDLLGVLNLSKIDFIKIDVEGMEQYVLEGMEKIIFKYRPVIFCEIYKGINSNESPDHTISFIANKGYDVFVISEGKLEKYYKHNDNLYNYFFIPSERK